MAKIEELVAETRKDGAAGNPNEEPKKPWTSAILELWILLLNVVFLLFHQTKLFVLSSFRFNSLSGTNPLLQNNLNWLK
jgi:hypothetical protein